jgi:beta-glucanase (GH16 family)
MARTPRQLDTLRPSGRRTIFAALVVVGLIGLSLVSGQRDGSAEDRGEAALGSVGYIDGGAPLVPTTSSTVAQAGSDPGSPVTAPPTTSPPPSECGSDRRPVFGCPLMTDNFDGSSVNTGPQGWTVYEYPDSAFPRVAKNFHVADGEAKLNGTYDRASGEILGAGMASHISQKYGRWELRAKVDKGRGFSAASLLWPTSEKWPTDGEVDLFEIPRADRQSVFQVVHNGVRDNTGENKILMDATQWHTYAVEWTPTRLVYYVDNKAQWTVTKSLLIPSTGNLNMTIQIDPGTAKQCGRWFECPDASTPPVTTLHVDWVKVWKYSPDAK